MLWSALSLLQMWPAWRDVSKKTFGVLGHVREKHRQVKRPTISSVRSCRCRSSYKGPKGPFTHSFIHLLSHSRFHLCREKKFN